MEIRENEIIQQKINSVTELPEGYAPNLASKWELLEVGLKPAEKKRSLFWIRAISAAAVFLLLSTVALVTMKDTEPAGNVTASSKANMALPAAKQPVAQQEIQPVKPAMAHRHRKTLVQDKPRQIVAIVSNPVMIQDTIEKITLPEQPQTTMAVAEKAPRFAEMDFNEPVIGNNAPSQAVIESQRFKFKIGFTGQSNAAAQGSGNGSLFRKIIN